ncbi:hypothetical protein HMPREF1979_00702 [Actinomyces johnsonii F0542]|uniref:Uncharacterized protein n=1 Tax=Actinomyces johnsonii F0542 TaxID=1321818 RepID=U1S3G7_9ACTO|nr:hypothetical protein HMPREF1979_00702 [Actinomyces johnsonii F0542]
MRVRRGAASSQLLGMSQRLSYGRGGLHRVPGRIGSLVSKSVTKDRRSPDRMNENLGIMRFHSRSPATVQAFVTDLDILGPVVAPDGAHVAAVDQRAIPHRVSDS